MNNVSNSVRIAHDLTVHGEAWKMGGSAQWCVLSDARVGARSGQGRVRPSVTAYRRAAAAAPAPCASDWSCACSKLLERHYWSYACSK